MQFKFYEIQHKFCYIGLLDTLDKFEESDRSYKIGFGEY